MHFVPLVSFQELTDVAIVGNEVHKLIVLVFSRIALILKDP